MTEAPIHCAYIDGTTGIQCVLAMARIRGIPSNAVVGHGTLSTGKGLIENRSILTCRPALEFAAHQDTDEPISYDDMVKEQMECSHYDTERKIPTRKSYG